MNSQALQLLNTVSTQILDPIVQLMFAVAVVYFMYGVVNYIAKSDSEDARTKGKRHLLYSVIGLVIMVGVWGILELIINTLGASPPEGFDQLQ